MKTISKILLVLGVFMVGMAASLPAQSFSSASFLTGTNLLVNGGSTNLYTATNIWQAYSYGSTVSVANARAFQDVGLWANRDGSALTANIAAEIVGLNANATNKLDFLFYAIPRGVGGLPATTAQNSFQFTVTASGTTNVVVATNIPTAWLQGCGGVRLDRVVSIGLISGTNVYVKSLTLDGFRP